jgi:acyl dehydratase
MTDVRTLDSAPGSAELYARAALPMIPLASRLPFVAGHGSEIPDLELEMRGARADPARVKAYAAVCGFAERDPLPPTFPHILAFPLHMRLMTDGRFPFGAVGLVHILNRIAVHRPVAADEALDLRVRATPLQDHPKGRTFSLVTEARVGDELVWEEESTMLRRGKGSGSGSGGAKRGGGEPAEAPPYRDEWSLPDGLGRRYAGVSGDRNPIHLHPLSARAFGFPRAIAHGMWTKARCLGALGQSLPDAFEVSVEFRKPILLPARVIFGSADDGRMQVRSAEDARVHLDGAVKA